MPEKKLSLNDLLEAVNVEIADQKLQLENQIESYKKKSDKLAVKESELDSREAGIIEREKVVKQKENDIEFRWSKLRRDEDVQEQYNETILAKEQVKTDRKAIEDLVAENDLKLETIKKKELDLCDRESTYKEKIERELAKKVINLT